VCTLRVVDDTVSLSHEELVALAGLVRLTIEADERLDPEEVRAVRSVATAVTTGDADDVGAYRTVARVAPLGEEAWAAIWQEAVTTLRSEADVKAAASRILRNEAREAIYVIVSEVAAADTIAGAEWELLEWLEETWGVRAG
jgi:hypothetical protein